tara:strand:+ start:642 stop:1001 length:360 start_codon:yes stop_codon:yes gene_type:complete
MLDDVLYALDDTGSLNFEQSHKNDVLEALGSPSIKIKDVDDVWIYLVSVKEEKVFDDDEIHFQEILRFQFDDDNIVKNFQVLNQNNFTEIAFSNERTTITRDAYGIADQLYDSFTRGTN